MGVLFSALARIKRNLDRRTRTSSKSYASYVEAVAVAGAASSARVGEVAARGTVFLREKLQNSRPTPLDFQATSVAVAVGLAQHNGRLNCIDFGGSAGHHYFTAAALFGTSVKLRWHIVELPEVVESAKRHGLENEKLKFFSSLDSAVGSFQGEAIDLVFSSGTLQNLPMPEEGLRSLVAVGAQSLYLARSAFLEKPLDHRIIVHRTPLAWSAGETATREDEREYASTVVTFCQRRDAEAAIRERYNIEAFSEEDVGVYRIDKTPVNMYRYFCRLT